MEKLDNFIEILKKYATICNKICEKPDANNIKISVLDSSLSYNEIKIRVDNLVKGLSLLKNKAQEAYYVISIDFNNNINSDFSPLKVQYNELLVRTCFTKSQQIQNVSWEDIFLQETNDTYKKFLDKDYPYEEIFNETGLVYKKFQNILRIIFWLNTLVDNNISKNEKLLNTYKTELFKNEKFSTQIKEIEDSKIEAFTLFVRENENIHDSIDELRLIKEEGGDLIENLNKTSEIFNSLLAELKKTQTSADDLLKTNQDLASNLTSRKMSATFSEAAIYYNESKSKKNKWIAFIGFGLLVWSIILLWVFDIDKMTALNEKYMVLILYTLPKLAVFGVMTWILKFLIAEYRKDAQTALDFKHRQAIADVTSGFREQIDSKEKQDQLVKDAFDVLLNTKDESNYLNTKETKLFFEKFTELLEIKGMKDSIISQLQSLFSRNKESAKEKENDS